MKTVAPSRVLPMIGLLSGALLLAGCSGSDEDVRESFCKNLAVALLPAPGDVEWEDSEQRIQAPEYAAITVRVKGGGRTTCWFQYDIPEETARTHVEPLSAYSTLPYQVSVNGQLLSDRATLDAVNAEQIRQGKDTIERLRQAAYR